jgi:hypothetical protein
MRKLAEAENRGSLFALSSAKKRHFQDRHEIANTWSSDENFVQAERERRQDRGPARRLRRTGLEIVEIEVHSAAPFLSRISNSGATGIQIAQFFPRDERTRMCPFFSPRIFVQLRDHGSRTYFPARLSSVATFAAFV